MITRKALAAAATAVAAATLLAACSSGSTTSSSSASSSSAGGPVVIARSSPTTTLNTDGATCSEYGPMIYDSLFRISTSTKVENGFAPGLEAGLATSYTYDAKALTYTVHLRPSATFNDGKKLTSADVVWDLATWKAGPVSGGYLANITSATAPDAETVVFHIAAPDALFAYQLAGCNDAIMPKNYGGETAATYYQKPIGAGPFMVSTASDIGQASEKIVFVKNPHYWRASEGFPKASSVTLETIGDGNQQLLQFQNKTINILVNPDSAQATSIGAADIVSAKPQQIKGYLVNTKDPKLSNVKVREALSLAIDRKAIAKLIGGGATAATSGNAANLPDQVEPTNPYEYDVSKAKSLLASAGESKLTLSYIYASTDSIQAQVATVLQSELAKIGVNLTLKPSDVATQIAAISKGDYQLGELDDYSTTPTNMDDLDPISTVLWGWSGLPTTEIAKQSAAIAASTTLAARKTAMKGLVDSMQTEFNYVGVINVGSQYAVQGVTGFTPNLYTSWNFDTLAGTSK